MKTRSGPRATLPQQWWRISLCSIGDAVIACDEEGRVIFINPIAESLTGWTQAEAEGKSLEQVFRIVNEQTRRAVANPAFRVLREGIVSGLANHTLLISRDGTEIPIDDSSAPIKDEHDHVVGVILVFRDITERRRSELTQLNLAAIVESSDDAIIGKTLDGIITSWNRGAERIYGYTAEEVIGKPISIITPPEQPDEIPTIMRKLRRGVSIDHYETVRMRKDGARIDVSVTISPIKNKSGQIVGASAIARDITERKRGEESLRKSEAQLNGIISSAMDAIIAVDADQRIVLFNSAAETMFGCSAAEAQQQPVERFIPERFRKAHRIHIPSFGRTNVTRRSMGELGTICGVRADGEEFPVEASISQIEIGGQKRYTVILRDVTERKRAEEALRKSEERLRIALDAARMGAWEYDLTSGRVKWSSSLEALHGLPPGTFGGRFDDFLKDIHPDDLQRVTASVTRTIREGADHDIEYRIILPDGKTRWMEGKGRAIADVSGKPIGVAGVCTDITERKRDEEERERLLVQEQASREEAEQAMEMIRQLQAVSDLALQHATLEGLLPEMLRQVRALLRTDYISILLVSEDGRYLTKRSSFGPDGPNQDGARIPVGMGIRGRIAAGRAPLIVNELDPGQQDADLLRENVQSLIAAPLMVEARQIGVIHADSIARRQFAQDDLRLLQLVADRIALSIDHARLFEAEQGARLEAEEANRLKDEFLATLSHELRNPLHSMLGWLHLLRAGKLSSEAASRALETIERNARAQSKLVEDLLDVSRVITGKLRLNVRPVELAPVIEAAVEAIQPAADAKGIRIERILDTQTDAISGDPDRLQQVVWNLISNAIKFTPKGGRIQVRLERINSHVEIIVSDTGIGINPGFLPYVFDRFRQAEGSSARPHGGLGLGLAIVRHLAELHGGTVQAQSEGEGKGATFIVKLPLMVSRVGTGAERVHPKVPLGVKFDVGVSLSRLRLLVVDDEADARELLTAILTHFDAEVKTASATREALRVMAEWRPDVLISDIEMPDEDGYELIRRVRTWEAELGRSNTPAVALTAYARIEDRLRALAAGFQIHVPKPVEPAELAMVVASLTGRLGRKANA